MKLALCVLAMMVLVNVACSLPQLNEITLQGQRDVSGSVADVSDDQQQQVDA